MNTPFNSLNGFKPLVYLGDLLVLSRRNHIYTADLCLNNVTYICSLPSTSFFKKIALKIRLLDRLLRLGMGPAIPLSDNNRFLVCFNSHVFCVDISTGLFSAEFLPSSFPRRPLQMLLMRSKGHEGVVLCGDYARNSNYFPVNIYRRLPDGSWTIVFSFSLGEVNHIHGIFEDIDNKCLYILTGDFHHAACIWVSNLDFSDVKPLSRIGQNSRACWVALTGQYLCYATDQQELVNSFCSLDLSNNNRFKIHFPIVGSSIYFSSNHSNPIVFSTTVEPMPTEVLTFGSLFSNKPASGILSNCSCIYSGSLDAGFAIIFKAEKDFLPFNLFQLGSIQFPSGESTICDYVHFYCTSLIGLDGNTYVLKLV